MIVLEGLTSVIWTACEMVALLSNGPRVSELREEYHCEYDADLGWANRPGVSIPDFYGPEQSITIDTAGLRSHEVLNPSLKPDPFRVICLGDSFTLGYGVDDQETFPFLLQKLAAGQLHVSNMGQGGYSIGQSWLWLRRLAPQLKPNLVVCVFIVEDFRRLGVTRTANGFAVPHFQIIDERVQVENTPVPGKLSPGSLMMPPGEVGNVLRKNSAIARSLALVLPDAAPPSDDDNLINGLYIIREIKRLCDQEKCEIAFALTPTLPELFDLESKLRYENVARVLSEFMAGENIPFKNLQPAFLEQKERSNELFLEEAFHHYSAVGNAIVANELLTWLPDAVPQFPTQP
jgi:lysophospholipase L1-like esterase